MNQIAKATKVIKTIKPITVTPAVPIPSTAIGPKSYHRNKYSKNEPLISLVYRTEYKP